MNKKILVFQTKILEWHKTNGRSFYWRKKKLSAYQYIIAEVLLQRTKAETIAIFYPKFLIQFPNWKSIADSNLEEIKNCLKPIGLYNQRATRLKNLAIEMEKRNGEIPFDRKELESIPFMGQYIVNAIELIIFGKPSPLLDVNMSRVIERFFGPRELADIRYDPYLQKLSKKIVQLENSKEINWAILDFASLVCKARNPLHDECPLKKTCAFLRKIKFDRN